MNLDIRLRDVIRDDLRHFFRHQQDREAVRMAAVPTRDRKAFVAHWTQILADESVATKTILADGRVAGNVVSFERSGKREVGYWIARDYWGQGVATRALAAFLDQFATRPLYAHVAQHNVASMRVLEKCGFKIIGDDPDFSNVDGERVEGVVLELA